MQFYRNGDPGVHYGVVCEWDEALHHVGSTHMTHLKKLMEMVDYISGHIADELIIGGQRKKHARIAAFAGKDYVIAYDYLGDEFALDTKYYEGFDWYIMSPVTGILSYGGKCGHELIIKKWRKIEGADTDRVIVIKK